PPSGRVPTRNGSPADNEIDEATRDFMDPCQHLTFTVVTNNPSFMATNSIVNILQTNSHPGTPAGEGPVTGQEVTITVTFDPPIGLETNHYFFRPEALLSSGDFLWLSAPKTIPAPADLQTWMRNEELAPDWLRV